LYYKYIRLQQFAGGNCCKNWVVPSPGKALLLLMKMIKQLLIIILADLIVLIPFVASMHPEPSATLGVVFIIPVLVLINIVAGFVLMAVKKNWAAPLFINAVIAPVIFYSSFSYIISSNAAKAYKRYYFESNQKNYSLDIDLNDGKFTDSLAFTFYEVAKNSSGTIGLGGHYTTNHDTLFLLSDSGWQMKVFDMGLYNFPGTTKKIRLTTTMPSFP
jgi:hypothetical protein